MIRLLPIAVRPVEGETPDSFFGRLADANAIAPESLWGFLRQLHGGLPFKRRVDLASTELEALGGLAPGWFASSRQRHLLPVRCPHNGWKFAICATCSPLPAPQTGCLRCGHGQATKVIARVGPICLKHSRWHFDNSNVDVGGMPGYRRSERDFRRTLTSRGISLATGEFALARRLVQAWGSSTSTPSPRDEVPYFADFPLLVKLTVVLTDPRFVELLLSPRWSPSQHATLLSTTVTSVVGHVDYSPSDTLWVIVNQHAKAVATAYGMVGTNRTSRSCTAQRAFVSAAYTERACLLRHLDAKNMPRMSNPANARRAPSTRQLAALQRESG